MATEKIVPDWHVEPHYCTGCPHQWHSVPCEECPCVTSCSGLVIVPAIRMPDVWEGDNA